MASRTKLIGLQIYDSDGSLDYFIDGSYREYFDRQVLMNTRLTKEDLEKKIKKELTDKFLIALEAAFEIFDHKHQFPGGGKNCVICNQ